IEESPSPSINEDLRKEMGEAAVALARAVKYTNAGTVEFLFAPATKNSDAAFYFLEVNTRLQVEHPVTEEVTLTDLVQMQILAAEGKVVEPVLADDFKPFVHAIECRICAEDAENNFFPSTGTILYYEEPEMTGIRYDSGVETGSEIPVHYDSMIAKVISVAETREGSIQQMLHALDNYAVLGITTNKDFLKDLLSHPSFIDGSFDTKLIERDFSDYKNSADEKAINEVAVAAFLYDWNNRRALGEKVSHTLNGWRGIFYQPQFYELEYAEEKIRVDYRYLQNMQFEVTIHGTSYSVEFTGADDNYISFVLGNHRQSYLIATSKDGVFVQHPSAGSFRLKEVPRFTEPGAALAKGGYTAPMPGEIVKVLVKAGDKVSSGKGLLVMSSMKMETTIEAHSDGEVEEVFVAEKNFVEAGTVLVKMKAE
ncbi:MAG TPA: biotin/lipoyl-containing protein, partial [Chitinophagales bacterium]|nr:biotin/lipoyl-containing protein [Chitinophagales bacterium]